MKKIGVLYGRENTFPFALIERINQRGEKDIVAESVTTGAVLMDAPVDYRVILDRISQDVPFYRAMLKNAVLNGVTVVNNPFWWSADDKNFNYALASKIGIAIPKTVLLPHKQHPPDINAQSLRNLMYPLNWEEVFAYVGFPAFLKPHSGGGWKHVYKVNSPEEFFHAYAQTGDLCMTLQEGIEFDEYYRCYVVGQKNVRIMQYDPRLPHANRYVLDAAPIPDEMVKRVENDCLTICKALGYDMNTVEFAVRGGVPYAIDFLNPAPDADLHSVGPENFEWFVNAIADFLIAEAKKKPKPMKELRWSQFLG
jgi:glutathione synthase/RimK-type ligase-like ATP-grasp enzyme